MALMTRNHAVLAAKLYMLTRGVKEVAPKYCTEGNQGLQALLWL
jgi:hypothetical protein